MSEPAVEASRRVVVCGRVQGAGYSDFLYMRARFSGRRGYVRNLPDMRSLEVVPEGERASLEQLPDYLREGPRGVPASTASTLPGASPSAAIQRLAWRSRSAGQPFEGYTPSVLSYSGSGPTSAVV